MRLRLREVLILGLLGMLVSQLGASISWGQASDCDALISPSDSIQSAIESASGGDVLCLASGEFAENLSIVKSITLRGAGQNSDGDWLTSLAGVRAGVQIIDVFNSGDAIDVIFEDMQILGAQRFSEDQLCATEDQSQCPDGIILYGDIHGTLRNVRIAGHADDAISVFGGIVVVEDSVFESNGDTGVLMHGFTEFGASTLHMSGVDVRANGLDGMLLLGPGELIVESSSFSGNADDGLSIIGSFDQTATVINNEFLNNGGDGIFLQDEPVVLEISNNQIAENGNCGIRSIGTSGATGSDNGIRDNAGAPLCGDLDAGLRIPLRFETSQTGVSYPGEFDSLQQAVDAVARGGRIVIAEGTFSESVTLWKPVSIVGQGADQTSINGMFALTGEAQGIEILELGIAQSPLEGILLHGEASARVERVSVHSSNTHGITLWESAQLELYQSVVSNNGTNPGCNELCHGIVLNDSSSLIGAGIELNHNSGWGITASLMLCGFSADGFSGTADLNNITASGNGLGDICLP